MKKSYFLSRGRLLLATTATAALIASSLPATAALASEPTPPGWAKPVPGSSAREMRAKGGVPPRSAEIVSAERPSGSYDVSTDGSAGVGAVSIPSPDGKAIVVDGGWHQLGGTGLDIASAGDPIAAKDSSAQLKASKKGTKRAKAKSRAERVSAAFVDTDRAKKLGLNGPVLELKRADGGSGASSVGIRIPVKLLEGTFGADYASRVRWVQLDAKKAPTTAKQLAATEAAPVAESRSRDGEDILLAPRVGAGPVMVMAMAGSIGGSGTGDFTASPLKPSAAWDVSAQTGTFSWQYPLRVPPAPAGPAPDLALSYDSQSVDGLTGSTNNQPSAIGEGWALSGGGFIERSYVGCAVDDGPSGPVKTSGDLCWKNANATVSFAGHSGELIPVAGTNQYRLSNDDGTRFTELKGAPCAANGTSDTACWQMVTTDGTQYYFGLNRLPGFVPGAPTTDSAWTVPVFGNDPGEPCHASTFAASACSLAWRWNLDWVVDMHGNAEAFYYNAQTNSYAKNGGTAASYVRGGELARIEYGLGGSNAYASNAAAGKVTLGYDKNGRCSDDGGGRCTTQPAAGMAAKPANPSAYPDIPFDQLCASGTCSGMISPTFWTTSKLSSITTQVLAGGSYKDVDSWALKHSFPEPGDGTSAALWLSGVTHTGHSGSSTLTEPAITFGGTTLQNRVWAVDGLAPLDKWRISSIKTELGSVVSVNYSGQECGSGDRATIFAAPQDNVKRCFPQWWAPSSNPPQPPQQDLFHKYVVTSVLDDPNTGGVFGPVVQKYYSYATPGWRYNDSPLTPADKRTWSIFAGFATAEVRVGDYNKPAEQNVTKYTFFRGLNGDRASAAGGVKSVQVGGVADDLPYAGRVREQTVTAGVGGPVVTHTATVPWASATAGGGLHSAWFTGDAQVVVTEPLSTGGNRTTTTTSTFDSTNGLPVALLTAPSDAPARCVTTAYAQPNVSAHIFGRVAEALTTSGPCEQAASAGPDRLISHERFSYDGAAPGAAVARGDVTTVQRVTGFDGTSRVWSDVSRTVYDSLGRATQVMDALTRVTKTAYTPSDIGGPTTKVVRTNPIGWTASTEIDPAWGAVVKATDENGKVTAATYDALGRRVGVWLPNRPQSDNASSPSTAYSYTLSQTGVSSVRTETIQPIGSKVVFELLDGLGRSVQSQAYADGSGSVISDTVYDSQGREVSKTSPYWATTTPSGTAFVPTSMAQVPSRTDTAYDAAGRAVSTVLYRYGDETKRTAYGYLGADRVDLTPPAGGTPTSTITNSLGQKTALTQFSGATPAGSGLTTTYGFNAAGKMSAMKDPAGNEWSWSYDVSGNQTVANDPDSGSTTSAYDVVGNLIATTDARGQTLAYTYDELNRRTAKYSGSTSGALLASWSFDGSAKGHATASTSYVGSTPGKPGLAYAKSVGGYDDLYNPTSTTVTIPAGAPAFGGTSYTTSMTYNPAGSIKQRSLPAIGGLPLEKLQYTYNGDGNALGLQGTTKYAGLTYTPTGQVSQIKRGLTQVLMYTGFGYEPDTGEVAQVLDESQNGAKVTRLANRTYKRNGAGDVTSIATTGDDGADTQCFAYGAFHALSEAWTPTSNDCAAQPSATGLGGTAPYWTSYRVDEATGNRLSTTSHSAAGEATTAYAYPAAGQTRPHAVSEVGDAAYAYDASGNTVSRPGQSLSWDESGKLASVSAAGTTQSRVYDADGNVLLQMDSAAGSKLFLGETELTIAPGASAASAVRTYSVPGTPVAERSTKSGVSGSTLVWLAGDLNHTQDVMVDATSGKVTRRFVDPYGNPRGAAAEWGSGHGYLNGPLSALTGLTQLGARAYDAVLGRFMSVDPVLAPENPQQNNGYSYSANNPITNSDPDGECYVGGGIDSLSFKSNCAGGYGLNAPAAYQAPAMAPSSSKGNPIASGKKPAAPSIGLPVMAPRSCGYWMPGCVAALPEYMSVGKSPAQILQFRLDAQRSAEAFDDDFLEFLRAAFEVTGAIGSAVGGPGGKRIAGKGKGGSPKALQKLFGGKAVMPPVPPGTPLTAGGTPVLTKKMQAEAAARHGWSKVPNRDGVFDDGKYYYTWDRTGHKGGVWKQAGSVRDLNSKETRMATLDDGLNRVGD